MSVYGWKVLKASEDGILYSPVVMTEWPSTGYLEANDISDLEKGSKLAGTRGIYAVDDYSFEELYHYLSPDCILALIKYKGKVYVAKTNDNITLIVGQKAKLVAAIGTNSRVGNLIKERYGIKYYNAEELYINNIESAGDLKYAK